MTHALLLMIADDAGRPAAYTYCPYEEDWVDRMTEATRRQLRQPRLTLSRRDGCLKARNGRTAKFAGLEKVAAHEHRPLRTTTPAPRLRRAA